MTKRELEIRLEVAESVIAESINNLSEEKIQEIMNKHGWDHSGGAFGAIGYTISTLNHYMVRADEAVKRDGRDIFKKHID